MNPDEIKNVLQIVLTLAGGLLLSHGYVTANDWTAVSGALMALVGPVWSIFYHNWNMKKVPENSVAVSAPPTAIGRTATGQVVG